MFAGQWNSAGASLPGSWYNSFQAEDIMVNRSHWLVFSLMCTVFFVMLSSSSLAAEPIVIRFSHVVSDNSPKGFGAKLFKAMVEKQLAGEVEVIIYPLSQKYTDEQAILGLLFGDVEMVAPSFPKFYKFSKALAIYDQPFFFNSMEDVHRFQESDIGRKLLSSMEDRGIKGLAYWDNGMRVISTHKAVRTPADLDGMRIRIEPSNIIYTQYQRWGALPLPMPFKQLPDALRGGLIDGYENAWSNVYSRNLHLLRRYFTDLNHSYLGYMVATSVQFWDSLPADIRTTLEEILEVVRLEVGRVAAEKVQTDREKVLATEGVELITLSEGEIQPWKELVQPLWEDFEAQVGKEMSDAMIQAKNSR